MASIKQLLEKATLKLGDASRRRMPENTGITLPENKDNTEWQSYVPPSNGYIQIFCETPSENDYMTVKDAFGVALETRVTARNGMLAAWVPVWKAVKAAYRIYQVSTKRTITFWKTEGGGG